MRVLLRDLCATRAGDKGDIANVALFAYDKSTYELLAHQLTPERVRAHFGDLIGGPVRRYDAPNVFGLNFVLENALGGGGARSLRSDSLGKTLGGALLRMAVDVPADTALPRATRPPLHGLAAPEDRPAS